jgi:hypothetical protein
MLSSPFSKAIISNCSPCTTSRHSAPRPPSRLHCRQPVVCTHTHAECAHSVHKAKHVGRARVHCGFIGSVCGWAPTQPHTCTSALSSHSMRVKAMARASHVRRQCSRTGSLACTVWVDGVSLRSLHSANVRWVGCVGSSRHPVWAESAACVSPQPTAPTSLPPPHARTRTTLLKLMRPPSWRWVVLALLAVAAVAVEETAGEDRVDTPTAVGSAHKTPWTAEEETAQGAARVSAAPHVLKLRHAPHGRVLVPADGPRVHPQLQQARRHCTSPCCAVYVWLWMGSG